MRAVGRTPFISVSAVERDGVPFVRLVTHKEEVAVAEPSAKHSNIVDLLEHLAGRTTSITSDVCLKSPFGCGGPATEFRDNLSRKEYTISGLCQTWQDSVFGEDES